MNIIIRTMFIFMIIIFSCSHCGTKYLLVDTGDKGQDYNLPGYRRSNPFGVDRGIKIPAKNVGHPVGPAIGLHVGQTGFENLLSHAVQAKGEDYAGDQGRTIVQDPKLGGPGGFPGSATNRLFGNGLSENPSESNPPCNPAKNPCWGPPELLWG